MTPRDALLKYLYLVSADEGLNLSPHKLRHVCKLWNEAMFQKCTLVMLRTGKNHHTKWSSQVLFRVHGEFSGASFVAVQRGTRNPGYHAMSRLFLTLAQARFLNWVLQEGVYVWQMMGAMPIRNGEQNLRSKGLFLIFCFYNWRSGHDQRTCPPSTSWQRPHLLGTLCWAPPALTSLREQVLQVGNWIVVQKLFISSKHLTEVFSLCSELDSTAHYCFHIQGGRPQGGARCLYTPETSSVSQNWSKYSNGKPQFLLPCRQGRY